MIALRSRVEGKTPQQQQRAVSGRMITDIEMNGAVRGAVEEYNLCANLRSHDALFAECIRTFPTVDVNAQQWLHRLSVELERVAEINVDIYVPVTRKPNVRTARSTPPLVDIYGFRPLHGTPFEFLTPFEFIQFWTAEPLVAPS